MCALVVGTCSLGSAGSFPYELLSCALFGPRTRSYGLELSALFVCALTFFRCLHLFAASRVVSSIRSRSGFSPGGYLVLGVSFKMPLCSRCLYIRSCISFGLCGSDGFSGLGNCVWREWSVQPLRVCSVHLFCLPLHHFRRDPF